MITHALFALFAGTAIIVLGVVVLLLPIVIAGVIATLLVKGK